MTMPWDTKLEIDVSGVHVMIGMPCIQDMPWQTVGSLIETCIELKGRSIPFDVKIVGGCSVIEQARTHVVKEFLESKADRLFMVDADIVWEPKDFLRLLALSVKMEVIGAIYPTKRDQTTFLMSWDEEKPLATNEFGCLPINGMGLGFTVFAREVIEKLADRAPKLMFPGSDKPLAHVFRCDANDGAFRGEDMAFFSDARSIGYQPYLEPKISLGHVGRKVYTGSIMNAMQKVS